MKKPRAKPRTESDTATVDAALDFVLFADEVIAGLRGLAAAGGLEYFDERERPQP